MREDQAEIRRLVGQLAARDGQAAVAEAVGVSQPTVSRFLRGRQSLTFVLASGLGRAYPELRPALARLVGTADAVRAP